MLHFQRHREGRRCLRLVLPKRGVNSFGAKTVTRCCVNQVNLSSDWFRAVCPEVGGWVHTTVRGLQQVCLQRLFGTVHMCSYEYP